MSSVRLLLAPAAGVLTIVCVIPYLVGTMRGRTKPQRMSWFIFTVMAAEAAASQLAAGASAGAWLTGAAAAGFGAIFVVSLRHGVGGFRPADVATLLVAVAGLVLWRITGNPVTSLVAVVGAELAAIALTVTKAYREPTSETATAWLIDAASGAVALAAVAHWTFRDVLYPLHHTLVNLAVLAAIQLGRHRSPQLALS
jgi:hypothetical protein